MSFWGLEKIRNKTWKQLLLDGLGHAVIGIGAVGIAWGLALTFGTPITLFSHLLAAFVAGFLRECWQYVSDDTPSLNLLDRLKDISEAGFGGFLICLVRYLICQS